MPVTFSGLLVLSIFPVLVIAGGIGDFLTMRIPNWLNAALVASFFVMIFVAGMPFEVVKWHLAAGAAVFLAGLILFFAIGLGGGDAKMLAAVALWVGWSALGAFHLLYGAGRRPAGHSCRCLAQNWAGKRHARCGLAARTVYEENSDAIRRCHRNRRNSGIFTKLVGQIADLTVQKRVNFIPNCQHRLTLI